MAKTKYEILRQKIDEGKALAEKRYKESSDPFYHGQLAILNNLSEFCKDFKLKKR